MGSTFFLAFPARCFHLTDERKEDKFCGNLRFGLMYHKDPETEPACVVGCKVAVNRCWEFSIINRLMFSASDTTGTQSSGTIGPPQSSGESEEENEKEQNNDKEEKNRTDERKVGESIEEGDGKDKETMKNEKKICIYKEIYTSSRMLHQFSISACGDWKAFLIEMHEGYKKAELEYAVEEGEAVTLPSPPSASTEDSSENSSEDSSEGLDKHPKTLNDVFPGYELMYVAIKADGTGFTEMKVKVEDLNDGNAWIHFALALDHIVIFRHVDVGGDLRSGRIFIMDSCRMNMIYSVARSQVQSEAQFRRWLSLKHENYMNALGKEPSTNFNEHSLDKVWPGFNVTYEGKVFGNITTTLRLPRSASAWRFFIRHLDFISVEQLDVISVFCDVGDTVDSLFVIEKKDCKNSEDFFAKLKEWWGRIDIGSARCFVEGFHGSFRRLDAAEDLFQWAKDGREEDHILVEPELWENLIKMTHHIVVKKKT